MTAYPFTRAIVERSGRVSRRSFLQSIGIGGLAALGWHDRLALAAPALRSHGRSMIVLWMQGGPTQFETFDPKSHSQAKSIQTAIPGVPITEHWPNVAKLAKDLCIVRSMSNKEGNHQRATYQLHTGYVPSGAIKHPGFGSLVAHEIAPSGSDLPAFVSVLGPSQGSGFLPVTCGPFQVSDPSRMPDNSQIQVSLDRFRRRLKLLDKIDKGYAAQGADKIVADHQGLYENAAKLVRSTKINAFDISGEPEKVRSAYGDTDFGQGCLLARRLVEAGVTYVEVELNGWDTHADNANKAGELSTQCDKAMAALISDLKKRGLLDSTLVVWMGEFGRTPKINGRAGRDHYPRAFSMAMAGGGVPGGQVLGKTDDSGASVVDRPVAVNDLFTTFCKLLKIDPAKENMGPLNRPMKIVDGGTSIFAS